MGTRARLRRLVGPAAAVDTHDVGGFRSIVRRTGIVRLVLAGGAVALVLAAAATARDPQTSEQALVPPDRIGVVVLDLSLSITDDDYVAIRRTLRRLVAEDATIGLAVFSDVPYELLPPGTPASELKSMLRLLVAPRLGPVRNPWTQTFRAGTRISVALELAKSMLERDQIEKGSILLVSDLETAPDDVPETAKVLRSIKRAGTPVRLLALGPSSDARALFGGILGQQAFTPLADGPVRQAEPPDAGRRPLPRTLLVLAALFLVALAGHERYAGRLALPTLPRRKAVA